MKFMHMADVHLGAVPDAGMPWCMERSREIWDTFARSLEDARRERVDLLLIAGDLFHRPPTMEQLRQTDAMFGRLEQTRIVLIAGNHDCVRRGDAWNRYKWGRNVVCLLSSSCECVRFPEIHTEVYGLSYHRQEIREPLYDDLYPEPNGYFHILLAHGGDADHIPVKAARLAHSPFDYIALGHIHRPQTIVPDKALYSGALTPIDSLDTGPHGYLLGNTDGKNVSVRFVEKAPRSYKTITLPCTESDTTWTLCSRAEAEISREGKEHIYRIILEGTRGNDTFWDLEGLRQCGRIIELEDHTTAGMELNGLKETYGDGLIGRYIRSFEGSQPGSTQDMALKIGLEALLDHVRG